MTASTLQQAPIQAHRFALLDRLVGSLSRLAREIRIRNDLRRLGAFDDAALSDIGVSRGGIEGAVRSDGVRRP